MTSQKSLRLYPKGESSIPIMQIVTVYFYPVVKRAKERLDNFASALRHVLGEQFMFLIISANVDMSIPCPR